MSLFQEYVQPQTIDEALGMLSAAEGSCSVIAGGTDLLLDIRQGRHPEVDLLIDVSAIEEMKTISLEEGVVYLGASVTHKRIVHNAILQEHARCVVEGCGLIGGPQVRNVATIGGNVAHALPAGDGTVALLAMDAEVQLASSQGRRWLPLIEIFAGPGRVTFDRGEEMLVGFRFSAREDGQASAFKRVMRPQGVAIAILNMAARLLVADGEFRKVQLSCGPAGPQPFRAYRTEEFLNGQPVDSDFFNAASQLLAEEVSLRTSAHRATKEYRHVLLPVLLQDVLEETVSRSLNQPYDIKGVNHD